MKREKVFFITGGGFANKGAEAMALTVKDKLLCAFSGAKVYMQVKPRYFKIARQYGFIPVDMKSPETWGGKIKTKISILNNYLFTDARIDIGGYQFGDPWSLGKTETIIKEITYCNFFKIKTIFMPQAMGPFENKAFQRYIPTLMNKSSLFFIRDKQSFNEVSKIYPVNKKCLQPDIAWNFIIDEVDIDSIMEKYMIDIDKPTVCLTPNLRVYERQGSRYLSLLKKIIAILGSKGYQVILLGHELSIEPGQKDDRYLCRILKEINPFVIHVDEFLSAKEIKSIIRLCTFTISSRFHSLIAALSQMIPSVAIGWSHKYNELLSEVGLPDNILTLSKEDVASEIESYIETLIDTIAIQKSILRSTIPGIVNRSATMLDHVISQISQ